MRILTTILFLGLTINLSSQSIIVPSIELVGEYKIKTIFVKRSSDGQEAVITHVLNFDKSGNLLTKQYFSDSDTTLDNEIYYYDSKQLKTSILICSTNKEDTIKTLYSYDTQNKLITEKVKSTSGKTDYTIQYSYPNDSTVTKTYHGIGNQTSGCDSIIYNDKYCIKYLFNVSQDKKVSYKYKEDGRLWIKSETSISNDTQLIFETLHFYYKGVMHYADIYPYEEIRKMDVNSYPSEREFYDALRKLKLHDFYKYEYYE